MHPPVVNGPELLWKYYWTGQPQGLLMTIVGVLMCRANPQHGLLWGLVIIAAGSLVYGADLQCG